MLITISRLAQAINDDLTRATNAVTELQLLHKASLAEDRQQKIYRWLSPPDPSLNHNAARGKRKSRTGTWLIDGDQLAEWKNNSHSFLWLHGIRKYFIWEYREIVLVTYQSSQPGVGRPFSGNHL